MKFINPPAKNAKDEPNVVKITNRTLHPDSEEGDKFEIPADKFIYPEAETLEEAKQLCGGENELLAVFNNGLKNDALSEAKNKIRMASTGSVDDIIEAAILAGKNYTYIEQQKISASEAKEKFSELRNLASQENMSDADLAAALRKALGL